LENNATPEAINHVLAGTITLTHGYGFPPMSLKMGSPFGAMRWNAAKP